MSERLQFIIMAGFALLCFGCGYLTAFIVTRNRWRDEMIERHIARYDWQTGKWEWGKPRRGSFPSNLGHPIGGLFSSPVG